MPSGSIVDHTGQRQGSAALFTELVELRWDHGAILMRGRSGDYIANGHMSPTYAAELYMRLGELLRQRGELVELKPKKRKRKR